MPYGYTLVVLIAWCHFVIWSLLYNVFMLLEYCWLQMDWFLHDQTCMLE